MFPPFKRQAAYICASLQSAVRNVVECCVRNMFVMFAMKCNVVRNVAMRIHSEIFRCAKHYGFAFFMKVNRDCVPAGGLLRGGAVSTIIRHMHI